MKRLFIKVIRDLLKDKLRTVLALLAIIVGTTAFGGVLFTYSILNRELVDVFASINPASASVGVNRIDDNFIGITRNFHAIQDFEEKAFYVSRIKTANNQWKTVYLFAVKDFSRMKINKIFNETGKDQPGENEILIEKDALELAHTALNRSVSIAFPDSSIHRFKVVGIAHDMSLPPATMENIVYAYVSYDSLVGLGLTGNRIDLILAQNKYDKRNILAATNEYIKQLEQNGYQVNNVQISNTPGMNPHQTEYKAILIILQICGILAFILGCMIISSLLTTLLSNQIKQIGIFKAIGARTGVIFLAYISVILLFVLLTIGISLPLAGFFARNFAAFTMGMGNFEVRNMEIPLNSIILFLVAGSILPILIAIAPIRRGTKVTVKEALSDYGIIPAMTGRIKFMSWVTSYKIFSRPVILSIRNSLRRKGRFYLNLISLTLGGAIFIASVITITSIERTISKDLDSFKYDYQVNTGTTVDKTMLAPVINGILEIKDYEHWGSSDGKIVYRNGQLGNQYPILAPPYDTKMFTPQIMQGHWLTQNDINEIVVGHQFFAYEPDFEFGDTVTLRIGDQINRYKIVGTVKELGPPTIFLNKTGFDRFIAAANQKNNIKFTIQPNVSSKEKLFQKIDSKLKTAGIRVLQSENIAELHQILEEHGMMIVLFFMVIAIMIVVVATFGLASTMSVQVFERTKEIGIMKAMGASPKQIKRIVTAESIFIGISSWLISVIVAVPLGFLGCVAIGNIIIRTPLELNYEISNLFPFLLWLILAVTVGYFAGRGAAGRAVRLSVKEALAFE